MKSFNVMLVFAAVGTAYAAVDDTRPKTPCKTMPANWQECRERSIAMLGVGKFYGSFDVPDSSSGCVDDGEGFFFNSLTTVVPCVDAEKYPGGEVSCVWRIEKFL